MAENIESQLEKLRALYKMARLFGKLDKMKEIRTEAEELKKNKPATYEEAVEIFNS